MSLELAKQALRNLIPPIPQELRQDKINAEQQRKLRRDMPKQRRMMGPWKKEQRQFHSRQPNATQLLQKNIEKRKREECDKEERVEAVKQYFVASAQVSEKEKHVRNKVRVIEQIM